MAPEDHVGRILASLPCSVELPAGTGKTELIGRLVEREAQKGHRTLVLTHTHAGVDVVRRRLKRMGVSLRAVSVRTIDSWTFDLISKMPQLSGIVVGVEPEWKFARAYHEAARSAAGSKAIIRMLRASYELVLVDEYQDCQLWQHELISTISTSVPTCVLGDRMQGLFYFAADSAPVDWDGEVTAVFADQPVGARPWRWVGTNPALGEWLLGARTALQHGAPLDLADSPIAVVPRSSGTNAFHATPRHPATTVAITRWPGDAAVLARRLGGAYTMIEEIEGKHLRAFARIVDTEDAAAIAAGTVQFAIDCAFGLVDSFSPKHRAHLRKGTSITAHGDPHAVVAAQAVNAILHDPSASAVRLALTAIGTIPTFRLYRREAWFGVLDALRLREASADLNTLDAVVSIRTRLSRTGRRPESRIVGRPLLVKGLEFEHAVLDNPVDYNAHELYVSLSRASTTTTVIADQTVFTPARPERVT